jgi:demethylmenaquinone methyltransferase/2-methoxy-6-polyprenyl-1,4-benzoquinol methylase
VTENYTKGTPDSIKQLFGTIAPYYDRANQILSFGLHHFWNRSLVRAVTRLPVNTLLDLCAGTGDIAFHFLRKNPQATATLLDFCPEMLAVAKKKGEPFFGRFATLQGDAQNIPFKDSSVDAVTVAYGIRNVHTIEICFREAYRVLREGGNFGILELTRPSSFPLRFGHSLYLKICLPLLGRLIASNQRAYTYLSQSIATFVSPEQIGLLLKKAGFSNIWQKPLTGGIATLIVGQKSTKA